ncbi:MAG: hypothetical protein H6637_05270 [Ardenticatenales bacterium]|nr:hypothetical protein [Ardenticatenales bacterium]
MVTYVMEGVITLLSSLSHGGESRGTTQMLRREKVVQADGAIEELPVLSGNSIRGRLRDVGMAHMLRLLGYGDDGAGVSLAAYYFLMSGGSLGKGGSALNIDEARRWRELIPLVSLFGGAMGNQIMPGKLKVEKGLPICAETAHLIPERFGLEQPPSIWEMVQVESYTRTDDEKSENLRGLIAPSVRGVLEDQSRAKRQSIAMDVDLDVVEDTGTAQQMRYHAETLAAGTRLFWGLTLDDVTDVEFEALAVALAEYARTPYLGGKSSIGHGRFALEFDSWIKLDPRAPLAGAELDTPLGGRYIAHLRERRDEIRGLIDGFQ